MADRFEIKADGSWEYHGEDSRLRDRTKNQVTWRIWNPIKQQFEWQTMDKVYCRDCGADGGYSSRSSACVVYFCDKCWEAARQFPQYIPMLPTEEWRWRNGLPAEED
jgi:hypothetical protein